MIIALKAKYVKVVLYRAALQIQNKQTFWNLNVYSSLAVLVQKEPRLFLQVTRHFFKWQNWQLDLQWFLLLVTTNNI